MIGTTISHYRILERLGAGGMGEVYKAEDTRLGRQVALKLLTNGQNEESGRRFLREAQAAAALNHPNIATVYEIDQIERDGVRHSFIAMEYVPGPTLGEYAHSRRLGVAEAVELVRQIAETLDAAHSRGIVHRDIKPSNVMVTGEGRVKVLDFGLARFLSADQNEALRTTPGLVMGTFSYMSPEQACGEEVDERSDIFSLGVVFYELLTGRLPFTGNSTPAIINSLLHSEPPALQASNSEVTPELERLVRRMLEKNRERRCRAMREVLRELETNRSTRHLYQFGSFQLDVAERRLARDGQPVSLKPKVFDLLVVLVENRGRLLEKEQLYQALWPDSVVEEVNLNVNVSALRKALGETPTNPQFIETIPKKGYRFIAAVTEQTIAAQPVRTAARPDPGATQLLPSAADLRPQLQAAPPGNTAAQSFTVLDSAPLVSRSRPLALRLLLAGLLLAVMATAVYVLRLAGRDEQMAKGIRTVAVLPFRSLQGGEADQALGLGMADALITRLGSLQLLTVRPTSAVLKYAAADADSLAAGRELKVDAVLEGRVQREEKMIRISAQLLRVTDGAVLWAGKFDDFFTNIFAVQDSLSEKMAEMLAVRLTKNEQQAMTRRYTENTEAYQLYLLGSYHHYKLDEQDLEKALSYYQAAIEKDPHYPLPWAAMVGLYIGRDGTDSEDRHYRDKARAAAEKAISLAPELSEAWDSRGTIQMCFDWDFSGAGQSLRRAIELNPGNPDAHDSYALLLSALKRDDEAIREIETACRLAPTSAYFLSRYGTTLLHARRYDQAVVQLHKALELDPRFPLALFNLADALSRKGQHKEALEQLRKYRELTSARAVAGALIQVRAGQRAEAEKVLAESLRKADRIGRGYYNAAVLAAFLGDREGAFELLEKAIRHRENGLAVLGAFDEMENLRNDPRFESLRQQLKPE